MQGGYMHVHMWGANTWGIWEWGRVGNLQALRVSTCDICVCIVCGRAQMRVRAVSYAHRRVNACARSCHSTRIHTGTRSRSHAHPKHVHACAQDHGLRGTRDREATPSGNLCFRQLAQLSVSAIGPAHRRSIPASKGARSSG